MLEGKRGALEIFEGILANLSGGPLRKARLTHRANLDSLLATKHIGTLIGLGLVTKLAREGSYFIATGKGRDFLEQYYELVKLVNRNRTVIIDQIRIFRIQKMKMRLHLPHFMPVLWV